VTYQDGFVGFRRYCDTGESNIGFKNRQGIYKWMHRDEISFYSVQICILAQWP